MFKKLICSIILVASSSISAQTELKVNLASALLLVPNIGIEVQLSEKFGYQLDTSATFFKPEQRDHFMVPWFLVFAATDSQRQQLRQK